MLKVMPPVLVLALFAGIWVDKQDRQAAPEGVAEYHAAVRENIDRVPFQMDAWVGVDTELRQEALRILDANVSLSRTYRNLDTGQRATLLLVQCEDARSLLGHYPPRCYPAQGWTPLGMRPLAITAPGGHEVPATEYLFEFDQHDDAARINVLHFVVVPRKGVAPDMDALDVSARDRLTRHFGGASLQIVVDAGLSGDERMDIYRGILKAAEDWIAFAEAGETV